MTFFIILFIITWIYQGYVFQDLFFRWPELIIGLVGFAILGRLKTVISNQKKIFEALHIKEEGPEESEAKDSTEPSVALNTLSPKKNPVPEAEPGTPADEATMKPEDPPEPPEQE